MNIKDFILGYLIGKGDGGGGSSVEVEPLEVTENGEYSEEGVAYSPVTVNVSGGLEYEEGTWSPSEDIASHYIQFNNTHKTPPAFYAVVDSTNTNAPANSNIYCNLMDNTFLGGPVFSAVSGTNKNFGNIVVVTMGGSNISTNYRAFTSRADSGNPSDLSEYNMRHWADESSILAYCNNNASYWRAGRTYKWIAIWK